MPAKRVTRTPTALQLFLTKECNLKCSYCSSDEFLKKEREPDLSTKEWIRVLKRLKEIQVFEVAFSGGEIFLRKDILEILKEAVKCNFPKLRLTTNGTLISNELAVQLRNINLKNIAVSLDGNRDTHDFVRGSGSFDKAVRGTGNLIDNGIVPTIRFTPLKSNYKQLNELVDILYPLGIKRISLNSLHSTGRCNKIYEDIMPDCFADTVELKEMICNIREKYSDLKISNVDTFYKDLPGESARKKSTSKNIRGQTLKPCSAAHSTCNISAGGWVIPCSELFDFKGGNIREQDILDIWRHSEAFAKIRNLSNIFTDEIYFCKHCDYNVLCSAGCRADAYAVFGNLLAPDPFCPYWKTKEDTNV